jgi:hypothetical protein
MTVAGTAIDRRPGLDDRRLTRLMHRAIERCALNLSGATVLTEAASGAYVVTPVLAALAGADRVLAVTRATRYGSVDEIRESTLALARRAGVDGRIDVVTTSPCDLAGRADIVTNSGHVRPIDARVIAALKPRAVIALMYEAWEFRPADLDLAACARAGVRVAATMERHPQIDVFSFLGPMAVRQLHDADLAVNRASILLICDNPFAPFLERGLRAAGADVELVDSLSAARGAAFDAIVVSLTPGDRPVFGEDEAVEIASRWPDAIVSQFWGDIERKAFQSVGVTVWPPEPPKPGHMGILLSDLGPDPIVRLQTGGLKAAEVLWRFGNGQRNLDLAYVEPLTHTEAIKCPEFS